MQKQTATIHLQTIINLIRFITLGQYYKSSPTSGSRGSGNNYWVSLNTRAQYDFSIQ